MFLGFIVLALSLACGEATPTSEPRVSTATQEPVETQIPLEQVTNTPVPTNTPKPTATPQLTATSTPVPQVQLSHLGDVIEQYGYSLSAVTVEDPTTPSGYYSRQYGLEEGKKLIAVEIIVGNISGEMLSINPLNATLVDSEGFIYEPELAGRDGQLGLFDLNAGEKAKGWVAFKIPEGATPASIKYEVEGFSGKFLQVGLTK